METFATEYASRSPGRARLQLPRAPTCTLTTVHYACGASPHLLFRSERVLDALCFEHDSSYDPSPTDLYYTSGRQECLPT